MQVNGRHAYVWQKHAVHKIKSGDIIMKRFALLVILGSTLIINYAFAAEEDQRQTIRKMTFTKRYLNMPVKHGATRRVLSVVIDSKIVREFVIELADNHQPDYWVWLDIDEFRGKKAALQIDIPPTNPKALAAIYQDDKIKEAETFYKEKNRQQFHFSTKRGCNTDANGLIYYKGEYHLFYQHNPYGWNPGLSTTWGHAVSNDCVHWTEIGDAIHPDRLGLIFSGSSVIDHGNTAGFQSGEQDEVLVSFYTNGGDNYLSRSKGQLCTQSMAYSHDRGRTYSKYKGNPIIKVIHRYSRDPKVFWHEPTKRWVMVLFLDGGNGMGFFTSEDLKNWTRHGNSTDFHECPEFFKLPIDGDESNSTWVISDARGNYIFGDFDGKNFTPHGNKLRYQYGNCYYASQTFSNMPKSDPRRIQIAWGRIDTPGMPFNQCMLFPVNLTLRTTDQGVRMFAEPIAEIKNLHGKKHSWKNKLIMPDQNLLAGLTGDLFHIRGTFSISSTAKMSFNIRGTEVLYDAENNRISCRGKSAKLKPENGKIVLEMLVDRNSIEIFANNGRVYMPIGGILPKNNKTLELSAKTAEVKIDQLEIYELNSIWK